MQAPEHKYFSKSLVKTNFFYGLVGVAVGLVIIIFECVFTYKIIPVTDMVANLVFSTIITLSITNSIYLVACIWRSEKNSVWRFILIYYGCNILGMLIGIELSYLVVSFIFHVPFHFLRHFDEYRFCFLIVIIVSTIIYFYRAQQGTLNARIKQKELDLAKARQLVTQAELQTLQSKINPHFLYNSLNSIASLIRTDADKAEDMTIKLSRLFRYSINSPRENMSVVGEEMEIVNTYLAIEKVRFGDRLHFEIHVDEEVKNNQIPRFLVQPLVENALKHGLNDMPGKGELKISVNRDGTNIVICVADNGKPFPDELDIGYGLQSTYDKLTLLYGENYQVQIANSPRKQIRILIPTVK